MPWWHVSMCYLICNSFLSHNVRVRGIAVQFASLCNRHSSFMCNADTYVFCFFNVLLLPIWLSHALACSYRICYLCTCHSVCFMHIIRWHFHFSVVQLPYSKWNSYFGQKQECVTRKAIKETCTQECVHCSLLCFNLGVAKFGWNGKRALRTDLIDKCHL